MDHAFLFRKRDLADVRSSAPANKLRLPGRVEVGSQLHHLQQTIHRAAELLPLPGPITAFAFLNTLQALESLPFDDGVVAGSADEKRPGPCRPVERIQSRHHSRLELFESESALVAFMQRFGGLRAFAAEASLQMGEAGGKDREEAKGSRHGSLLHESGSRSLRKRARRDSKSRDRNSNGDGTTEIRSVGCETNRGLPGDALRLRAARSPL